MGRRRGRTAEVVVGDSPPALVRWCAPAGGGHTDCPVVGLYESGSGYASQLPERASSASRRRAAGARVASSGPKVCVNPVCGGVGRVAGSACRIGAAAPSSGAGVAGDAGRRCIHGPIVSPMVYRHHALDQIFPLAGTIAAKNPSGDLSIATETIHANTASAASHAAARLRHGRPGRRATMPSAM